MKRVIVVGFLGLSACAGFQAAPPTLSSCLDQARGAAHAVSWGDTAKFIAEYQARRDACIAQFGGR